MAWKHLGDYIAGPSHVIPTGGRARFFSAVNVRDFQKVIPFLSMDKASFETIAPCRSQDGQSRRVARTC